MKENYKHLFTFKKSNIPHFSLPAKPAAFTLAEVLITLGIIGVVAAMTIPVLMTNIRAKQYTTRFKKVLSTLNNAGKMSLANYDFDYSGLDSICDKNSGSDNPENKHTVCALLNGTLTGKTFYWGRDNFPDYKIESKFVRQHVSMGNNSTTAKIPIYVLQDGTILLLSSSLGKYPCITKSGKINAAGNGYGCYGVVDVNGFAGPNKEATCSKGTYDWGGTDAGDCVVDRKDVKDIFPIVFYDSSVIPASNAGWYIFNQNW